MGLYVVEFAQDFDAIDRELRLEDDRLFLSYEIDLRHNAKVYRVLCEVAGDKPPVCIVEWRDDLGRPLPLSSGILERVRSQRARGGVAALEAQAANERMVEQAAREADEQIEETVKEMLPRMRGRKRTTIPRSEGLAAARRRTRSNR